MRCLCDGFPPDGVFTLNVDGSHKQGSSACGGLLRDSSGRFMKGFHCNLGSSTSVMAELWGLVLGLRLARDVGISSLRIEMDSRVVVNMIILRRSQCLMFQPLLEEALDLVDDARWVCSIHHIYREANYCADILASLGHAGNFTWTLLDAAPPQLSLALAANARSVSTIRVVR